MKPLIATALAVVILAAPTIASADTAITSTQVAAYQGGAGHSSEYCSVLDNAVLGMSADPSAKLMSFSAATANLCLKDMRSAGATASVLVWPKYILRGSCLWLLTNVGNRITACVGVPL